VSSCEPLPFKQLEREGLAGLVEVVETEGGGGGEPLVGGGNEGPGGEDEKGGAGSFGEMPETIPGRGGKAAEFRERIEEEVENEKRKVAVTEEEVGATQGFLGMVTAHPEEAGAEGGTVGGRVEAIAPVDQGQFGDPGFEVRGVRTAFLRFKQGGEEQRKPGSGARRRTFHKRAGIKGRQGNPGRDHRLRPRSLAPGKRRKTMRFRELLAQLPAKLLETGRRRHFLVPKNSNLRKLGTQAQVSQGPREYSRHHKNN